MGTINCIHKEKMFLCKQCAHPIAEHYLINQRGDYFCGDKCHEIFHDANAHEFIEFDDDHPYYFDYSSIRQEYIYLTDNWVKLFQKKTKDSNVYAQFEADDLIDQMDEIIWAYKDYIHSEGDDGIFAYEIYQYTIKLREIQKQLLKWRPERETYYALSCYYDYDYDNADSHNIINDYLNDVAEKEGSILAENRCKRPHPFHEYFDWIFDFQWERDYWLDTLSPYFQSSSLNLETYTAHLCDGCCNDFLDIKNIHNWYDGWFYCDSCMSNKEIGELSNDGLLKYIEYYNVHTDKIESLENPNRFRSLIRRACRIHQIEMPDWAII
jgi:hypothetical protein